MCCLQHTSKQTCGLGTHIQALCQESRRDERDAAVRPHSTCTSNAHDVSPHRAHMHSSAAVQPMTNRNMPEVSHAPPGSPFICCLGSSAACPHSQSHTTNVHNTNRVQRQKGLDTTGTHASTPIRPSSKFLAGHCMQLGATAPAVTHISRPYLAYRYELWMQRHR